MMEKLKKRIEATNGPNMDKVAGALMENMGKQWQAMIQNHLLLTLCYPINCMDNLSISFLDSARFFQRS